MEKKPALSYQTLATRAKIRAAALALFNEKGSAEVTTHDIAKTAGLSPGNLYYHYANKETIIRDLFEEIGFFSKRRWAERGPENPRESFVDFIRFFFGDLWSYRFFFREFSTLVRNDQALKKMWRSHNDDLQEILKSSFHLWVKAGIIKKMKSDADVDAFIENAWVLAHFSMSYLETKKVTSTQKAHEECLNLYARFLHPYHTEKGQRALELFMTA